MCFRTLAFFPSHLYQRIFILEGIFTVLCAIVSYWILADFPENAKFLSDTESEVFLSDRATFNLIDSFSYWGQGSS